MHTHIYVHLSVSTYVRVNIYVYVLAPHKKRVDNNREGGHTA